MQITRVYFPINEKAARDSRAMWSMRDYIAGSETASYKKQVDDCYKLVEELPEELQEKGLAIAERYSKKLAEHINKGFRIEMMCPSVLISGAGNFPVRKKEKQNAARDKHMQEYEYINSLPEKIRSLGTQREVIRSSDKDAEERLENKIQELEIFHAEMKEANAYFRKNKTLAGFKDYNVDKIDALNLGFTIKNYGIPFPSFELTNNLAKIKNAKARLSRLQTLKTTAKTDRVKYDKFEVVENTELMRLQLFFDGKPDEEIRIILKSNGFKWAPSVGAWQRQLTNNARYALKCIVKELNATEV